MGTVSPAVDKTGTLPPAIVVKKMGTVVLTVDKTGTVDQTSTIAHNNPSCAKKGCEITVLTKICRSIFNLHPPSIKRDKLQSTVYFMKHL